MEDVKRSFEAADIPFDLVLKRLSFGIERVMVRTLCPNCKTARKITESERVIWGQLNDSTVFEPTGCDHCQEGYIGKRTVFGLRFGKNLGEGLGILSSVGSCLHAGEISISDACEIFDRFNGHA
jgi:hypothetical protein